MSKGSNSPSRRPRTFSANDPNLFLVPNIRGDFNDPSNDGTGYGALSAAEQNQTYLAYFDGVGGTGPEIIDQTAYFIKYLIDTEGNVANPEPGNIGLINLTDNFELGKRAVVEGSTLVQTNLVGGPFNITGVGRIAPILVTETGSGKPDYINTMSFGAVTNNVSDVSAQFILTNSSSLTNGSFGSAMNTSSGLFQTESYGLNWTLNPNNVEILTDTSTSNSRVKFKLSYSITRLDSGSVNPNIQFRIVKNLTSQVYLSSFYPIQRKPIDNPNIISFETDFFDYNTNDKYYFYYRLSGLQSYSQVVLLGTNDDAQTVLNVVQEIPPATLTDGVNAIYKGNDYTEIIDYPEQGYSDVYFSTSSLAIYNAGLTQTINSSSLAFGFSNITIPFRDVRPGDFIRFEYNKNQVYIIHEISTKKIGSLGPFLKLKVTPNIGSIAGTNNSIEKSHFVLYRIINDGTYVILDVPKLIAGNSFSGILQPEYISQELKDKYSDIIQKLTSEGVIT